MPFPESTTGVREGATLVSCSGFGRATASTCTFKATFCSGSRLCGHAARTLVPFLVVRNLAVTGPQPLAIETNGFLITTSSGDGAF